MRSIIGVAGAILLATVLWDAFETIILPRRVSGRIRLTKLFYSATWHPWRVTALLLPRHGVRRDEHLEPLEIEPGVVEQRLIALQLAFELGQLCLERARVDLGQQVSAPDDLPLLEVDGDQLAVHTAPHRDHVERGDRSEPAEVDAHVARPRRRRNHRDARRGDNASLRAGGGSPWPREHQSAPTGHHDQEGEQPQRVRMPAQAARTHPRQRGSWQSSSGRFAPSIALL